MNFLQRLNSQLNPFGILFQTFVLTDIVLHLVYTDIVFYIADRFCDKMFNICNRGKWNRLFEQSAVFILNLSKFSQSHFLISLIGIIKFIEISFLSSQCAGEICLKLLNIIRNSVFFIHKQIFWKSLAMKDKPFGIKTLVSITFKDNPRRKLAFPFCILKFQCHIAAKTLISHIAKSCLPIIAQFSKQIAF